MKYGRDTPSFQKPRVIKCGEHEIGCARAQRGGPKEVMRLFEDLDLALGRDELGITRSPWAPPLDCCVSGAPLFRN